VTTPHVHVNGHGVIRAEIHVPGKGPWFADLDFAEDAPDVNGAVTLTVGSTTFKGTVIPGSAGTFMLQRRARIVAGAGGWSRNVTKLSYHNDAGVLARTVADDAAHTVGESIGAFAGGATHLRFDYTRPVGPASAVLEDAARGAPWWVDYAGITRVGARPAAAAAAGTYEVLSYNPRHGDVVLAVDDLSAVGIGSVLSERLDSPLTVRALEIVITPESSRVTAWCPPEGGVTNQLTDTLTAIVERIMDRKLLGKYRYRVVNMTADRVNLQAVSNVDGLPDLANISMWPGVAGAHAVLAPGAEVLIEFIAGNREDPVVVGFVGKGGPGHSPVSLAFCESAQAAARQGDLVQSGGPGTIVVFDTPPGGNPPLPMTTNTPYLVSFGLIPPTAVLASPLFGAISTGSPKVKL
jgi:hypothetical protein